MELKFLGCGSAFNPVCGNTSAYYTAGKNLYVIDAGESVFLQLYQKNLLAVMNISHFLLHICMLIMWEAWHL